MLAFLVVALVLLTFLALNVCTYRALIAFHPRRKTLIRFFVVICNLFWPCLFLLAWARESVLTRYARSILGPPWFSWLIFILLYSAFVAVVALVWLALRRRTPFGRFGARASTGFLLLLLALSVFGFYDALVPLAVRHVPIQLRGLPADLDGTKIALISDLHVGMFTRPSRLKTIAARAAAENPDFLVVAGDLVDDDPWFTSRFVDGFSDLPADLPIFAVLGNHEMYVNPVDVVRRLRAQQRVRLLVNEGTAYRRGGAALWLAGVSDYAAVGLDVRGVPKELWPDVPKALAGRPADAFPILLAHQPKAFGDAKKNGLPLTLCGHSHGGQFGIRPFGWSLAGVFLRYHMGLYREGAHQLYITTGAGYWLVPFRLGLPPEIVIVELKREP